MDAELLCSFQSVCVGLCAHTSIRDQQFYFPHIAFEAIDRGATIKIYMDCHASICKN